LQPLGRVPFDGGEVGQPDLAVVGRTRTPGSQQGPELGNVLRLHEEVREGRVGLVGLLRSQHDLGVGRDVDLPIPVFQVGDAQPAQLGIVLGGNHDLEGDRERGVHLGDAGTVLGVDDLVLIYLGSARLEASGPDLTGFGVSQEDEAAPAVARRVLAPASNGKAVPAAEPGARRRDHDRVAAIGEEMGAGRDVVGRLEPAKRGEDEIADERRHPHLFASGPGHGHRTWGPFLQQQFRRLDHGMGVKALPRQTVVNDVAQGNERHALVMSHVAPHDGHLGLLGQLRRGVVERLVEPVGASAPGPLQAGEVVQRRPGIQHGGERGGVGSHHDVLEQPSLEPQARHPEVRVLIGELDVAQVVARFGDTPRDRSLPAVLDLARHHETAGEIQQAPAGLTHHEKRHQVLEHGARPRDEGGAAPHRREVATQQEPVARRDVTLGDGHEASQPRLGGQEVVAAGIEGAVGHAIADGEELSRGVEEETEVHGVDHPLGTERERGEPVVEGGLRLLARFQILEKQTRLQVTGMTPDAVPQALRPRQDLGPRLRLAVARERVSDVDEVLCVGLQFLQPPGPFGSGGRSLLQQGPDPIGGFTELYCRDRLRTLGMIGSLHRMENQLQGVPDSLQDLWTEEGAIHELSARLSQGDQVACQIAAVDGRDVDRIQRPEVAGVVPVEEVAAESAQLSHGRERVLEPIHGVENPDPAEVMGNRSAQ
jgi:hypothetical protein